MLDQGFSIGFWEVGYGPVSFGGTNIRTRGSSGHPVGNVSVGYLPIPWRGSMMRLVPRYLQVSYKKPILISCRNVEVSSHVELRLNGSYGLSSYRR